jgi:uncharacterized DUF497 family protein
VPPARPRIEAFLIDDDNEDKFARHSLSARAVSQVLDNEHLILPNRKRRRARYLVIGLDNGGSCIAIPVEPTRDHTVWRPITAWPCKSTELAKLQESRR